MTQVKIINVDMANQISVVLELARRRLMASTVSLTKPALASPAGGREGLGTVIVARFS